MTELGRDTEGSGSSRLLSFLDVGVGLIYGSERFISGIGGTVGSGVRPAPEIARTTGATRAAGSVARVRLPLIGSVEDALVELRESGRVQRTKVQVRAETAAHAAAEAGVREVMNLA